MRASLCGAGALAVGLVACVAPEVIAPGDANSMPAAVEPATLVPRPSPWPVPGIDDADPIHVVVTDPRVLDRWDGASGGPLSLHAVLAAAHRELGWPVPSATGRGGDALLAFAPSWGVIEATLAADVRRIVADLSIDWESDIELTYDPQAAKTPAGADAGHRGNGNVARVFSSQWLRSSEARAPLVAMVYRPDRADFLPGTCGELRLIYRLAYEARRNGMLASSRLPMTINVVFTIPDDGGRCREVARSFRAPALGDDASAERVAAKLLEGPLAAERSRFAQIEVNAQVVRFPSDLERVEGRGFAGQALYWLRIFAPVTAAGSRLAPVGLENTPDVQAILGDALKQARLIEVLGDQLDAIDRGIFSLPDELLARVALSWSTHGSVRLANRPFATLLDRAQADALLARRVAGGPREFITDGAALLDRLDTSTCMGCHQSASTAGFHMLGDDRAFGTDAQAQSLSTDGNRLQLPISPHLQAEVVRRLAYAQALAVGGDPVRTRPHPAAPAATWSAGGLRYAAASIGMPCPLSGADARVAPGWACAPGSQCRPMVLRDRQQPAFGQCTAARSDVTAGAACREVTIATTEPPSAAGLAFNVRAFTDRVLHERPMFAMGQGALTTRAYNCRPTRIGVPLGRVTRQCRANEAALDGFDTQVPTEICGIVGGKGFEQMATGAFDPTAFAAGVGRGLLDTCSSQRPCREDYICQELPDFLAGDRHRVSPERLAAARAAGVGFCTPTYFVYQLRNDGHPNPL